MKPKLAFAYDPQFTEHVFAAEQLQRLAGLCEATEAAARRTLVVDEVKRFVRGEPLLHRVPHELLGQLA